MLPSTRAWPNRACPISLLFSSNLCDGSTQSLEPSAASTAILYIIYYVQYIYRAYKKKLFSDFAFMGEAAFLLCCGV